MPIVHVSLTAGRDDTVKSFIARSIVDSIAELAGVSWDGIHVLFTDVERSAWALGPRLLSESAPRPPQSRTMPFQRVLDVAVGHGRRDDYLRWRRRRLYPVLATTAGFLTASAIELEGDDLLVIERWHTPHSCDDFETSRAYLDLADELSEMGVRSTAVGAGSVADTWGHPGR